MKIALDKLNSKLKLKRISYLKYMTEKITHNPTQSCKEMENRKESLGDLEDVLRVKWSNTSLNGVVGGKSRENKSKPGNFPELGENMNLEFRKVQRALNKLNNQSLKPKLSISKATRLKIIMLTINFSILKARNSICTGLGESY